MYYCKICAKQGHTEPLYEVTQQRRYRVRERENGAIVFVLEDYLFVDNPGSPYSFMRIKCGRCGNELLAPDYERRRKTVQIKDINMKPRCIDCGASEKFLAVGDLPYTVKFDGANILIFKVMNDEGMNVTDRAAAELVYKIVVEKNLMIPMMCVECNGDDVNLDQVGNEVEFAQHNFDKAMSQRS